jgi:hypothetical protein
MSYARDLEDEIGGLDIVRFVFRRVPSDSLGSEAAVSSSAGYCMQDQLPPELREQARKEKHSQGGFR